VPELAYRIQRSIKQNVETMTKYKVAKVDVHVQDVIFETAPIAAETNEDVETEENETEK
jgi:uncharacterized alkaline shock family protein YloU